MSHVSEQLNLMFNAAKMSERAAFVADVQTWAREALCKITPPRPSDSFICGECEAGNCAGCSKRDETLHPYLSYCTHSHKGEARS